MNRTVVVIAALVALIPLAGCSVRASDDQVKVAVGGELINVNVDDRTGVDVKVPGVNVSTGSNGVDVKVPGVSVNAGSGGVDVKVPGVSVSVPDSQVIVTSSAKAAGVNPGAVPVDFTVPAEAQRVRLQLSLPLGSLTLDGAGTNAVTGQVGFVRTEPTIVTSLSGGQWTMDIPRESQSVSNNGSRIPDTDLHLGTDLPAALDLTVNLGDVTLDLQELQVTSLKATAMLGDMTIKFPAGANVRLTLKQAMGSNNLAAAGFVRNGQTWTSPDFKNENVIEADLQVNLGDLTAVR